MPLIDLFKKNKGSQDIEEKSICSGIIQSTFDGASFSGVSRENSVSKNTGWLAGITSIIANNVAQVPLSLYVKTESDQGKLVNYKTIQPSIKNKQRITKSISDGVEIEMLIDHPAAKLLKSVNNYTDGYNLFYLTQLWLDIVGDAYWYVIKDSKGVPQEIHIINPVYMRVVPNQTNNAIQGYYYSNGTDNVSFTPDEIVRFSNGSLTSRWYGQSPLRYVANTLEKMEQIDKLELSMLKNYGVPPLLLTYKGELTKNQIRDLELQWKRSTTNKNAGGAKVINGDVTVTKIAQTLSELMFDEQTIMNIKQLCLVYGVPYSFIDSTDQLKAGLDQMLEFMAINCVQPRLTRLEEVLNQQYIPMFDDSGDLFFKFDDPSPANKLNDAKIYEVYAKNGILTKDEIRSMLGYEPLEVEEVEDITEDTNEGM